MSNPADKNAKTPLVEAGAPKIKLDAKVETKFDPKVIIAALEQLNHADAKEWTADGRPDLATVQRLGNLPTLTEADIIEVAPDYRRDPTAEQDADPKPNDEGNAVEAAAAINASEDSIVEKTPEDVAKDVAAAKAEVERLTPQIETMQAQHSKLTDAIAALNKERDKHLRVVAKEDTSGKLTAAIKAMQKQNLANAHARAGTMKLVNDALKAGGLPTAKGLSPLDMALGQKPGPASTRKVIPLASASAVSSAGAATAKAK